MHGRGADPFLERSDLNRQARRHRRLSWTNSPTHAIPTAADQSLDDRTICHTRNFEPIRYREGVTNGGAPVAQVPRQSPGWRPNATMAHCP
jgi:hypothetical protein